MVILKVIDLVRLLGSTDATKPIQVLTHNQCNNKTIHGHGENIRDEAPQSKLTSGFYFFKEPSPQNCVDSRSISL